MPLRDVLDSTPDGRSRRQCKICRVLDALNEEDRSTLITALQDPDTFGHTRLARALMEYTGVEIDDRAVSGHRRRCHATVRPSGGTS
jgi:hypothetical protein